MDEPMTQERREKFWRKYGWSPELPENQRKAIEARFPDWGIEEAEALGSSLATARSNRSPTTPSLPTNTKASPRADYLLPRSTN